LTNGVQTRLEQAKAAAEQVLGSLPKGSSSALFFAADNVQPVIAVPTFDLNLLRKTIREAKVTDRGTDLTLALQQAMDTLQNGSVKGSREIYLITDGQACGWPKMDLIKGRFNELKKDLSLHVILVGDQSETNLAITKLSLESGLTPIDQPLRCSVEVANGSQTEAQNTQVSLQVDDETAGDQTNIARIPPKSTVSTALFAKLHTEGYHTITARISPPDRLPSDDKRTIAIRAIREVKVLLVQGAFAAAASEADSFYVRNALVPVAPAEVAQYYVKTTTATPKDLSTSTLDGYDAVYLLNIERLEPPEVEAIARYVSQGGGPGNFSRTSDRFRFFQQTNGK